MKVILTVFIALLSFSPSFAAEDIIRIQVGTDYKRYSNEDLRRRVWQLEMAVAQLQEQVFQLAMKNNDTRPTSKYWTCHIQSFGKTHMASGDTKASALAQTLKKCGDATNPVHCSEADVKCDNE